MPPLSQACAITSQRPAPSMPIVSERLPTRCRMSVITSSFLGLRRSEGSVAPGQLAARALSEGVEDASGRRALSGGRGELGGGPPGAPRRR
jgi:hypothetical protein